MSAVASTSASSVDGQGGTSSCNFHEAGCSSPRAERSKYNANGMTNMYNSQHSVGLASKTNESIRRDENLGREPRVLPADRAPCWAQQASSCAGGSEFRLPAFASTLSPHCTVNEHRGWNTCVRRGPEVRTTPTESRNDVAVSTTWCRHLFPHAVSQPQGQPRRRWRTSR